MKKLLWMVVAVVLLTGCTAEYEHVQDVFDQQPLAAAGEMTVLLPGDASVVTMENGQQGKVWMCDDYTVCTQTLPGGDLDATLRTVTGYGRGGLELICRDGRYDCVWVSGGEGGDQMNRAVILDDGNYHYVLTLHTGAEHAAQVTQVWQNIVASVAVNTAP